MGQRIKPTRFELIVSARAKLECGGYMTIEEVAALLDISKATVYTLPLDSSRFGRSLRFDPADVIKLITLSREFAEIAGAG